jgi:hypothetical protein
MKTVMVRYQVRAEAAAENEALIKEVFVQLQREQPAGLRYQSMKLADGVSFVHVATREGADASPLLQLPAFKRFLAGIKERCVVPPETIEVDVVGTYPAGTRGQQAN